MPRIKMAYMVALKINVVESDCIKTLKARAECHSVSVILNIMLVFP